MTLPAGSTVFTAYGLRRWPMIANTTGIGDTRFAPLVVGTDVVPSLYAARHQIVALLESVFHEVHVDLPRRISLVRHLASRGIASLTLPRSIHLFDLRDEGLERLGLGRRHLVDSSPAHDPCTRDWAQHLLGRGVGSVRPAGVAWGSRIAALARRDGPLLADVLVPPVDEVYVLFGDAAVVDPTTWHATVEVGDLTAGPGRAFADQVASLLSATIVPI